VSTEEVTAAQIASKFEANGHLLGEKTLTGSAHGKAVFEQYVHQLAKEARNEGGQWGASHSRAARGELSGHWMTPRETLEHAGDILDRLDLPRFALDAAASPGSAVCMEWFGPFHFDQRRRDALNKSLAWQSKGSVWCNPPYDKVRKFAQKCAHTAAAADAPAVLMLAYARTDTVWFHEAVDTATAVWFRKGRITFIDPVTGKPGETAPAPSALFLFTRAPLKTDNLPDVGVTGPWRLAQFTRGSRREPHMA